MILEKEYIAKLAKGAYDTDPLQYVIDVFEDPQNPGESVDPDEWQRKVLSELPFHPQYSVSSGHGTGKSAVSSWIIHWFIATHDHPQIVVTANTAAQLAGKTWRELKKWNDRAVNGRHFRWSKTKFEHVADPDTWFAQATPWSIQNSEAFAGTHEKTGVLMLFDEASAIPDEIYEVAAGSQTTEGSFWVLFGNPTRNTGRFRECFKGGREQHRWRTMQVDSRTARMTDKKKLQEWIEDYGEDSDFVRVRIKGEFPRSATSQFIPSDLVDSAMERALDPREYYQAAKVLGVDVAKGGENGDRHVIVRRQGRRCFAPKPFSNIDTMELVAAVVDEFNVWQPDVICVDGTGVGTGVVHRLQELGYPVVDVMVGSAAEDPVQYFNLRTEVWGRFREWVRLGGQLEPSQELKAELVAPEFDHTGKMQLRLEPKKYTKRRLGLSPDLADAIMLTFAADNFGRKAHRAVALPVTAGPRNGWWSY
jgi:hypothetical protein